ncbi:hypothetical protein CECT5772_09127 [Streptococcus equi subsp. ruminatorum CECT 5772]|uniref:Uncharacterized protein n=1 Tax=Streptococcus equi subsp. ruminatorum CECT 5772 TaxID=1051981 RepID=A0A922NTM1_9STRE|nr:hypothetical protein CECT5772_09127 [Streptococcus equi subsp. ruminatorum CECT 5772]
MVMILSRLFRCEADARSHTKKDLMVLIETIKSFCRACHDEGSQSLSASLVANRGLDDCSVISFL